MNYAILCEMVFTSDKEFFDKIGEKETKRYFEECYKFACNYKNLGEEYIVSSVVHNDETVPHMHLIYIPVVYTKDKEGNDIDKICARDFWRARDSYRQLQNDFHKYITSKGFELDRGLPIEETGAKHEKIEDLKKLTNFENTKKILDDIKLELPNVPEISDINMARWSKKRDEKIIEEIIKPKNDLIQNLYENNILLKMQLSRQVKLVEKAEKYQKERNRILADNEELHSTVDKLEKEYDNKAFDLKWQYESKIRKLEKENSKLRRIIDKFHDTIDKFIHWICKKFDMGAEDNLIRDFERENYTFLDAEKQVKREDREKEWDLER